MTPTADADLELPRGMPETVGRSIWRAAAWTGAMGAVLGAALGVCVAIACWLPEAGVAGRPLAAIRAGILGFLAAQHGGVTLDGTPLAFVPLGMVLIVAVIAWRAGLALADVARLVGVRDARTVLLACGLQALCYALCCIALVPVATLGSTTAPLPGVGLAAAALFGCLSGAALACSSVLREWWAPRITPVVRDSARAAAAVTAVFVGSGALLVAGSVIVHAGRVMDLSRLVGGGLSGLPILLLGALAAPNAAVAGASYLSGPGFAVGAGTHVDAFSSSHGTLPALPMLGALPTGSGASPLVVAWMVLTIVAAGAAVVRIVAAGDPPDAASALQSCAFAAVGGAGGMAALAWLGGGAAGTHRLSVVGASPWQVGCAVAGEVAIVSLPILGAWLLARRPAATPVAAPRDGAAVEPSAQRRPAATRRSPGVAAPPLDDEATPEPDRAAG